MAGNVSKPIDVDCAHLLHEDLGRGAFDFDFGSKGRRSSTRGRGCDQDYRAGEERIRLNDHAVPFPVLLVTSALGEPEIEYVTPTHADSP